MTKGRWRALTESTPNRLIGETSPSYLLQHAANPVDWFPWGEEALEKACVEEKPMFLSIGYSTSHWCQFRKIVLHKPACYLHFSKRLLSKT